MENYIMNLYIDSIQHVVYTTAYHHISFYQNLNRMRIRYE